VLVRAAAGLRYLHSRLTAAVFGLRRILVISARAVHAGRLRPIDAAWAQRGGRICEMSNRDSEAVVRPTCTRRLDQGMFLGH